MHRSDVKMSTKFVQCVCYFKKEILDFKKLIVNKCYHFYDHEQLNFVRNSRQTSENFKKWRSFNHLLIFCQIFSLAKIPFYFWNARRQIHHSLLNSLFHSPPPPGAAASPGGRPPPPGAGAPSRGGRSFRNRCFASEARSAAPTLFFSKCSTQRARFLFHKIRQIDDVESLCVSTLSKIWRKI